MCFVLPPASVVVSTNLYPGISFLGVEPSSFGYPGIGFPFLSTNSVSGRTVGVYVAEIVLPNLSFLTTVIPSVVPVNPGSGVNVTLPSLSIVYSPSPSTTLVVVPSSNVGGTFKSTSPVNSGVLDCGVFLGPSEVLSTVFVSGVTVGVYFADTSLPFLSTRFTTTPDASPTKFGSGVNVTTPVLPLIV